MKEGLSLRGRSRGEPRGWLIAAGSGLLVLTVALMWGALTQPAAAQESITIDATIEPARATVGDRLTLTIVAQHGAGVQLAAPDGPDDFAPLELIKVQPPETRDAGGGRQETRFVYILAAFQTGAIEPPPLQITVDGSAAVATVQPPAITIESVLPADTNLELRDVRGPVDVAGGTPSWVWATLLMAAFAAGTVLTVAIMRYSLLRPPPAIASTPIAAPEDAAGRELDAIAADQLLDKGEAQAYYGRIAACLRQYLSRRFDIPAVAMTPAELEGRLEALGVGRWPTRLATNLLQQCEAVQFAQYEPARERAEADLSTAYEVVELTRPDGQPQQEAAQPPEEAVAP